MATVGQTLASVVKEGALTAGVLRGQVTPRAQATARRLGAGAQRVLQTAADGAGARATRVAEAMNTHGMSKEEDTVLENVLEVLLAREGQKH